MTESEQQTLREQIDVLLNQCENAPWNDHSLLDSGWQSLYEKKVQLLCNTVHRDNVATLLQIAQQGTVQRGLGRKQSAFLRCMDSTALEAARSLVRLAEAQPSRELLVVLEALQRQATNVYAPLEFIPIRIRLARALKKINNLPIPASPPQPTRDLPIPTTSEEKP